MEQIVVYLKYTWGGETAGKTMKNKKRTLKAAAINTF